MKLHKCLAILCTFNLVGSIAQAATPTFTDIDSAVAQVASDSTLFSGWITDQFKKAATFNSTAGNAIPTQLKLFGVEVGVEGVVTATQINVDGFHNLGTVLIDTTQIDVGKNLPFPAIIGHAKLGLPFGMDAGIRIGGLPSRTYDDGDSHSEVANSIFGLDIRKKLIEEGMTRPFGLTLGLNYTHAKGHIAFDTPYTATGSNVVVNSQTVTPSLSAVGHERTDWKTDSVGLQAIINKKVLILNPYLGVSANHNSGTIESSMNNVGTLELKDPNTGAVLQSQALTAGGAVSGKPNNWDVRALGGMEISILPFLKLGLHGELGDAGRYGGAIGLRGQFR